MHTKNIILSFLVVILITSSLVVIKPIYFLYVYLLISLFTLAIMIWNYIQALKFAFSKPPAYMLFTFFIIPLSWIFSGFLFPILLKIEVASILPTNNSLMPTNIFNSFKWGDLLNLQNLINDYQSLIYNYSNFLPNTLQIFVCFLAVLIYLGIQYAYIAGSFEKFEFSKTSCLNILLSILLFVEIIVTTIIF
ncbi:hypothetical protein LTY36_01220 [Limosilactobacillus agrestis]|uniref:Uncharacterized protein n=1 Tax=Limosilactobacillus agrestis TaxID=2759748 RepID=A0A7W3UGI1_9LACO|nr:hypothetical protein [Limosilactobacillus agrestis]MBB1095194.1 hypothetical protein [Limosilactobacillus agrestis]MCD7129843.1 hypothetical protein [Limosilactobacillus agrestis]